MTRAGDLRAWAVLVVGAACAAVVAVIAGVALDAGEARAATPTRATIEATQFTVQSGQTGEAFAVCPGTKRAVGGGVVQSGPAVVGISVAASGPLDGTGVTLNTRDGDVAKQWYAAADNFTATQRIFKVFAICSSNSTATIEATPITIQPGQDLGEEFAVCPGNRRVLGGGVVQSGSPDDIVTMASGPLDGTGFTSQTVTGDVAKQWYAAVEVISGEQRTLKVFAICSGDSSARIKASAFSVESDQTGEAFARCGSSKRALGGGVVQSGTPDDLLTRASGPLDGTGVTLETRDGDVAKQWYAAQRNNSGPLRQFKVFAICE
ncbi:MAG TPA: hypothetical protein VFY59_09420 [Rubrobacter sp.]|nr:hypothetical protein [Rubrobacter sp.]